MKIFFFRYHRIQCFTQYYRKRWLFFIFNGNILRQYILDNNKQNLLI